MYIFLNNDLCFGLIWPIWPLIIEKKNVNAAEPGPPLPLGERRAAKVT
jgi:hypothetical protein